MRDLFLFLIFLFAVSKLEDGLLELVEDTACKGWDDFGKELKFFLFLVSGEEGFGWFSHVPVDFGQFFFAEGFGVSWFLEPFEESKFLV
jgi:hypothetical protein